jgi:hypothetical protein
VHIVNLVVKVILRWFDGVKKHTRNKDQVNDTDADQPLEDDNLDEALVDLMKDADKEEKEMDEGDEEDDIELEDDLMEVEMAMRQQVDDVVVAHKTKPVCHVLYKVRPYSSGICPCVNIVAQFYILSSAP